MVVVKARVQLLVQHRLRRIDTVDHALIEVGGPQSPEPAGEYQVVRIVYLREVVEASRKLGKGQRVAAAVVLDGEVALFDIDVRRAVTSSPQFEKCIAVGHLK